MIVGETLVIGSPGVAFGLCTYTIVCDSASNFSTLQVENRSSLIVRAIFVTILGRRGHLSALRAGTERSGRRLE